MMTHVNNFSVMMVENGFVVQEIHQPHNKMKTMVARNEKELFKVIKAYIKASKQRAEPKSEVKS